MSEVRMSDISETLRSFWWPSSVSGVQHVWNKIAPLIEQYAEQRLAGALVPKFKAGDRVKSDDEKQGKITGIGDVHYQVVWDSNTGQSWWIAESFLSPLPAPCNYWPHKFEDKPTRWQFCPLCGESLTGETNER